MTKLMELETVQADTLLLQGSVVIEYEGSENTYYFDQFGNEFYCKNYPIGEWE